MSCLPLYDLLVVTILLFTYAYQRFIKIISLVLLGDTLMGAEEDRFGRQGVNAIMRGVGGSGLNRPVNLALWGISKICKFTLEHLFTDQNYQLLGNTNIENIVLVGSDSSEAEADRRHLIGTLQTSEFATVGGVKIISTDYGKYESVASDMGGIDILVFTHGKPIDSEITDPQAAREERTRVNIKLIDDFYKSLGNQMPGHLLMAANLPAALMYRAALLLDGMELSQFSGLAHLDYLRLDALARPLLRRKIAENLAWDESQTSEDLEDIMSSLQEIQWFNLGYHGNSRAVLNGVPAIIDPKSNSKINLREHFKVEFSQEEVEAISHAVMEGARALMEDYNDSGERALLKTNPAGAILWHLQALLNQDRFVNAGIFSIIDDTGRVLPLAQPAICHDLHIYRSDLFAVADSDDLAQFESIQGDLQQLIDRHPEVTNGFSRPLMRRGNWSGKTPSSVRKLYARPDLLQKILPMAFKTPPIPSIEKLCTSTFYSNGLHNGDLKSLFEVTPGKDKRPRDPVPIGLKREEITIGKKRVYLKKEQDSVVSLEGGSKLIHILTRNNISDQEHKGPNFVYRIANFDRETREFLTPSQPLIRNGLPISVVSMALAPDGTLLVGYDYKKNFTVSSIVDGQIGEDILSVEEGMEWFEYRENEIYLIKENCLYKYDRKAEVASIMPPTLKIYDPVNSRFTFATSHGRGLSHGDSPLVKLVNAQGESIGISSNNQIFDFHNSSQGFVSASLVLANKLGVYSASSIGQFFSGMQEEGIEMKTTKASFTDVERLLVQDLKVAYVLQHAFSEGASVKSANGALSRVISAVSLEHVKQKPYTINAQGMSFSQMIMVGPLDN